MHLRYSMLVWVVLSATGLACEPTDPPVTALAFDKTGARIAAVGQAGLQVFTWPDLKRERTIKAAAPNLHAVAFSPDGSRVAVGGGHPSEEGLVQVFSWPAGKPLRQFSEHRDSVRSVGWHGNSELLSAGIDRQIKHWTLPPKTPASPPATRSVRTYRGHSRAVDAICIVPDGKTFVSGGTDHSVRVWDITSGELIRSMNQHTRAVHALALKPGREGLAVVASAAADRTIRFWQPSIGRMVRYIRLEAEPLDITWLGESGRIAAVCTDGRLRIVDADEVKVLETIPVIQGWAYAVAAHPSDGSVAVAGTGGAVRRIELR